MTTPSYTGKDLALRSRFVSVRERLGRFPMSILQLGLRVGVGLVFFNAGLLKFKSFEFAVKLFQDEYKVPLLDPPVAARMATFNELTFPVLLDGLRRTRAASKGFSGRASGVDQNRRYRSVKGSPASSHLRKSSAR